MIDAPALSALLLTHPRITTAEVTIDIDNRVLIGVQLDDGSRWPMAMGGKLMRKGRTVEEIHSAVIARIFGEKT